LPPSVPPFSVSSAAVIELLMLRVPLEMTTVPADSEYEPPQFTVAPEKESWPLLLIEPLSPCVPPLKSRVAPDAMLNVPPPVPPPASERIPAFAFSVPTLLNAMPLLIVVVPVLVLVTMAPAWLLMTTAPPLQQTSQVALP